MTPNSHSHLSLDIADPYLHELVVDDADIDGQGHVNNAVYVKWMDAAAWANSVAVGYDLPEYRELGSAFVVHRHEIDYLQSAYAGDKIIVATWPCKMVRFNAYRKHQIIRASDGVTLARAQTHWVYVDVATGRPRRMEPELVAAFGPRE